MTNHSKCPCGRYLLKTSTSPYCGQHPDGPPALTPRLVVVLEAAADGAPLAVVAHRLGVGRGAVAGCLTECYRRLGVFEVSVDRRRAAAVEAARAVGLLPPDVGTTPLEPVGGAVRAAEARTDRRSTRDTSTTPRGPQTGSSGLDTREAQR